MPKRFAAIGECMLEMSQTEGSHYHMGFGGDTLNVALYLARAAQEQVDVQYVTALGDDAHSNNMIRKWTKEGIGHQLVAQLPNRLPGLYFIELDHHGDRSFLYYRSQSAARDMMKGDIGDQICAALPSFDMLYFSGICLAILDDGSRSKLLAAIEKAKQQGTKIAFDNNYRETLWKDKKQARYWFEKAFAFVDIALPSFDDAKLLFGDKDMQATAKRVRGYGVDEIVVKRGDKGYLLVSGDKEKLVEVEPATIVVDTTAAGDSFNGGYLAARLLSHSVEVSANYATILAKTVIAYPGAIIPRRSMPKESL